MKKIKITDKKLAFVKRLIEDFIGLFFLFIGVGIGYFFTQDLDLEVAYSRISDAFTGAFMFFGFMSFCYIIITVERIFLYLKVKENEKNDIDN